MSQPGSGFGSHASSALFPSTHGPSKRPTVPTHSPPHAALQGTNSASNASAHETPLSSSPPRPTSADSSPTSSQRTFKGRGKIAAWDVFEQAQTSPPRQHLPLQTSPRAASDSIPQHGAQDSLKHTHHARNEEHTHKEAQHLQSLLADTNSTPKGARPSQQIELPSHTVLHATKVRLFRKFPPNSLNQGLTKLVL